MAGPMSRACQPFIEESTARPSSTGSTAIEAIVSGAPTSAIAPNVIATAASAFPPPAAQRRLRNRAN